MRNNKRNYMKIEDENAKDGLSLLEKLAFFTTLLAILSIISVILLQLFGVVNLFQTDNNEESTTKSSTTTPSPTTTESPTTTKSYTQPTQPPMPTTKPPQIITFSMKNQISTPNGLVNVSSSSGYFSPGSVIFVLPNNLVDENLLSVKLSIVNNMHSSFKSSYMVSDIPVLNIFSNNEVINDNLQKTTWGMDFTNRTRNIKYDFQLPYQFKINSSNFPNLNFIQINEEPDPTLIDVASFTIEIQSQKDSDYIKTSTTPSPTTTFSPTTTVTVSPTPYSSQPIKVTQLSGIYTNKEDVILSIPSTLINENLISVSLYIENSLRSIIAYNYDYTDIIDFSITSLNSNVNINNISWVQSVSSLEDPILTFSYNVDNKISFPYKYKITSSNLNIFKLNYYIINSQLGDGASYVFTIRSQKD